MSPADELLLDIMTDAVEKLRENRQIVLSKSGLVEALLLFRVPVDAENTQAVRRLHRNFENWLSARRYFTLQGSVFEGSCTILGKDSDHIRDTLSEDMTVPWNIFRVREAIDYYRVEWNKQHGRSNNRR